MELSEPVILTPRQELAAARPESRAALTIRLLPVLAPS